MPATYSVDDALDQMRPMLAGLEVETDADTYEWVPVNLIKGASRQVCYSKPKGPAATGELSMQIIDGVTTS